MSAGRTWRAGLPVLLVLAVAGVLAVARTEPAGEWRFAIIGDRTGGAVPGVYEEVWRETDADRPDFVINVGDSIQGTDDEKTNSQWQQIETILLPYRRYQIYWTPGNHAVWSVRPAQ